MSWSWLDVVSVGLQPPEDLSVSQWADKHRVLDARSSKEPGQWRTDRVPYLRGMMDSFCDLEVEEIVVCAGAQCGKTEFILNCMGCAVHQTPWPILLVYPTEDIAQSMSRNRIKPMIEKSAALSDLLPTRAYDFLQLEMKFKTTTVYFAWSNSPAMLASKPICYLFLDEIDKYPPFSGKEADPIALAKKRTTTFKGIRKIVYVSTPTLEEGNIWRQLKSANVLYRYEVPCPYCGHYQFLEFQNVRWPENEWDPEQVRELAWYECENCRAHIKESWKMDMLLAGRWVAAEQKSKRRRKIAFHLSALYSPFVTWGELAAEFLEAKDDPQLLMDFVNSRLAEPWREVVEQRKEEEILALRGNLDAGVVPRDAVALTMGVDTQQDGFYYVVHAWASDFTTWLVRYGFAHDWNELSLVLFESAYRVDGTDMIMPIMRAFIDSGGGRTSEVYEWVRTNGRGIVYAIKGMSTKTSGTPFRETIIDKYPGGNRPIPGGLRLVLINTDYYKDAIQRKMQLNPGVSGSWNLHKDVGTDYVVQMTAEEKRRVRRGLRYVDEWVRIRKQNHYLDASVYCFCAADHLQVRYLRPVIAQRPVDAVKVRAPGFEPVKQSWLPRRSGWLR